MTTKKTLKQAPVQRKADSARTYHNPDREIHKHEVFTPRHLVDSMMDKLEPKVSELDSTFFEPAAGDGNAVIAALERKLNKHGWTTENAFRAVKSIYACEYMKDNHKAIIDRIRDVLTEHGVVFVNAKQEQVEWCYSKIQDEARKNIVWCNTIDPWDTTDENMVVHTPTENTKGIARGVHRVYPNWLINEIPPARLISMAKKSSGYRNNKNIMWVTAMGKAKKWEAEQKAAKAKAESGQMDLGDLFGDF